MTITSEEDCEATSINTKAGSSLSVENLKNIDE